MDVVMSERRGATPTLEACRQSAECELIGRGDMELYIEAENMLAEVGMFDVCVCE